MDRVSELPENPVLAAALRWIKRGAAPIPVVYREKIPIGAGWQKQRHTAESAAVVFNGAPLNLGLLWGAPSNDFIDVDLDWPEACAIAPALLPPTAVYGRSSSRGSHHLFRVVGATTCRWTVPKELVPAGHKDVVLELRAEGTQSVVPPSTHPTGEAYVWDRSQAPVVVDQTALLRQLNLVAAGALLVSFWREGIRHDLALAFSGAALSAGYAVDEVQVLVGAVAQAAGDPEARDRALAARSSATAIASGRPATGVPKLAELIGEAAVAVLKRWLGLASALPPASSTAPVSGLPWPANEAVMIAANVATIEELPMRWLWPNRIARGKLHVIAGEPGLSKSVLTCAIAGIVTAGGEWPLDGTTCDVGDVLMLNVEDDPADTIRPRLRAAGADLTRVELITGVQTVDGKHRSMTLADVDLLDRYLAQHPGRFALLTCDPIGALMANKDTHRDSDVRSLLAPLALLAMKYDLAVVLVAHLNKATGMAALHRVVGSIGFIAAARMVYFLARDHEDPNRLLLVPGKANLAPMGMAGLSYELESADLGNGIVAPRICWHDVPEMRSANEVLGAPKQEAEEDPSGIVAWLHRRLAAGPALVRVLQEETRLELDASWRTIERTAGKMGIVGKGENKQRTWELPSGGDPYRQNDITTSRHEPIPVSVCPPIVTDTLTDTTTGSWRDVGMSVCRDAAPEPAPYRQNDKTTPPVVMPAPAIVGGVQQALLPAEDAQHLHPCTDCTKLNVGHFCAKYQRVMPEPATPNACVGFTAKQPSVPWTTAA